MVVNSNSPIFVNLNASGTNNGASWENAFTDLQSAISAATSGDEIWVAAGTYKPTNGTDRTISFDLPNGVTIYGGFAGTEASIDQRNVKTNVTILSGDIGTANDKSDNSHTVVKLSSGTATLDGFTIQDGNNTQADDNSNDGAGVYNAGDLTLKNVLVRNNQAIDDGGGIRNNGTITIIDSTIADNASIGTSDTSGGGGLINTGTSATIINSTFSGNTAKNGGAIRNDTVLNLINSTLSGNTASESGGGLANTINPQTSSSATATIINSTITNNTAQNTSQQDIDLAGGGVANFADVIISNSIIAGNKNNNNLADDLANDFVISGTVPGTNFVIDLPVTGTNTSNGNNIIGNGDNVSGFTDGTNGDKVGTKAQPINPLLDTLKDNGGATQTHALLEGSPAINAGDNSKIASDTADLDGDNDVNEAIPFEQRGEDFARIVGDNVDIGAVEFVAASTNTNTSNIIINEIDVDTPSTDSAEFIELYDGGVGNTSLDGHVIVLYNGSNSESYGAFDLDGQSTNANGYFVIGSNNVPNVNLAAFGTNALQNGADAIALYKGDASQFPDGTLLTTDNLVDAIVYETSDDNNNELGLLLNNGQSQVDENGDGDKDNQSLQRISNGSGGALNTDTYQVGTPTPGTENGIAVTPTPGITITQSNNITEVGEGSETDFYTVVLDSQPTAEVTVNVSTTGETTTDLTAITFTRENWDTPQTVTITAVDDSKVENNHSDTVSHTVSSNDTNYNNINIDSITVNIIDNDVEDNNPSTPTPIELTEDKDRYQGTTNDDVVNSGAGNDFLKGEAGNDVIDAGADNDRVYGGAGEDTIKGGTGNDFLSAGTENDSLEGGEGRDRLYGGDGDDTLNGGADNDFLKGESGNDSLDGGEGKDRLYGDDGDDTLTGGSGSDRIEGGDGADFIIGVDVANFSVGERDFLKGNAGTDTFVLGNASGAFYSDGDNTTNGKRDYAFILDFETGDTIQLHGSAEDYILDVSRGSTSIYLNDDGMDGLTRNDELIGVIKGVSLEDMSSGFSFAGSES